jgi:hypothetical protein
MSRHLILLKSEAERERAAQYVALAPDGTRIEFKAAKRSLPQNALMWSLLSDLAHQLTWYGQKLTADDWKLMFLDGLGREVRVVPNLDGDGFVNLGRRSSDLSKDEMSQMIELIRKVGAENNVRFIDDDAA